MKLRIRPLDSKETLKLEVADTSTVQELKEIISFNLFSSVSADQLFLTLNRKDELSGPSLQSLGVTSGDLIFYSLNPNPEESCSHTVNLPIQMDSLEELATEKVGEEETLNLVPQGQEDSNSGGEPEVFEDMEVDVDDDDGGDVAFLRSLSVPSFLKKVFEDEIGSSKSASHNMLLNVAVHAVLLESRFVEFDPVSCTKLDGFRLPQGFPSSPLHYTIPEVLSSKAVQTVSIKFQSLGKFVNVVGSLTNKVCIYRVCLDGSRFIPAFNLVWKNGSTDISVNEKIGGDSVLQKPEKDVFEFWKHVKDGIALPLLIDLCESVGLVPPSCFMLLPTDLKLKILELLPGNDIAKVACVCAELRFISSNDALWRQKYVEEFGNDARNMDTEWSWKIGFSMTWKSRKIRRESYRRSRLRTSGVMTPHYPFRNPVVPFGFPHMIGGDYDRLRGPGIFPNPFGRRPMPMHPNCNLGDGRFNL